MLRAIITAACLLGTGPAFAGSVDFEGLSTGFYGQSFSTDGFTFNTTSPAEVRIFNDSPNPRTTFVLSCDDLIGSIDCDNPLEIIFPDATDTFSMTIVSDDGPSASLALAFTTSSGVVNAAFAGFDFDTRTKDFYSITGLVDATSVLLTPVNEFSGFGYDDIRTAATVIPLPATGWLMLAGVAGLGALRRRSKA